MPSLGLVASLLVLAAGCSPKPHGCGEETRPLDPDDAAVIGVSARDVVARCPTTFGTDLKRADGSLVAMQAELTVDLSAAELVHVLPAQGFEIACGDDFLRVPASLTISTADDSFFSFGPASVTGSMNAAGVTQLLMVYNHTSQPLYRTQGTFTGTLPFDVDGYDAAAVSVSYACPSGAGAASVEITDIVGDAVSAFERPIGTWTVPTGAQP